MRALVIMLVVAAPLFAQQPQRWRLVEERRVGGEVDGPHSFGDVRGMAVLADGRIVLVEFKDQQVHIFDAKGRPLRSVGRRGAGPGEKYPFYDALHLDASGRLWVERQVDAKQRRFEVFPPRGILMAEVESSVLFRTYRPLLIGNDRVLGLIADEDDVVYLASYRIVRG